MTNELESVDSDSEANNAPPTSGVLTSPPVDKAGFRGSLRRGLSARQVQMIAIAGTIGTGLFLGTGKSLAQGGPASMLICYGIVGFVVYITLLLLGEMATQYPVAGMVTLEQLSRSYFTLIWTSY
jgi:amino acid permease